MSDPGLDLHEWETRWQELQEQLQEDAAGALPDLADFVGDVLADSDYELDEPATAAGASRSFRESYRAARDVASRVERGEDVDPGDVGQAVEDLRAVYESVSAARPG